MQTFKKQKIQYIFIKPNQIMLAFNVTWLMEIKKIYLETASDKLLLDKTFNIAKIPKQEGYQHRATFMVDKFFDKKFFGGLITRHRLETLAT